MSRAFCPGGFCPGDFLSGAFDRLPPVHNDDMLGKKAYDLYEKNNYLQFHISIHYNLDQIEREFFHKNILVL